MTTSEAERLEKLWGGDFGDAYIVRNENAKNGREPFWKMLLGKYPVQSVLEVGCNVGGNLTWLRSLVPTHRVVGVDVNKEALQRARHALPDVSTIWGRARDLPFRDGTFELTFTTGVLIHQPTSTLPLVMSEIVRASNRYVLCGEYFADKEEEVSYRGETGALFRRDYGKLYTELFPELTLVEKGFLPQGEGSSWDNVTWWLLEKKRA